LLIKVVSPKLHHEEICARFAVCGSRWIGTQFQLIRLANFVC
jgi:hypothetical protein